VCIIQGLQHLETAPSQLVTVGILLQVITLARTLAAVRGALHRLDEVYAAQLPAAPRAGGHAGGMSVVPMPHHLQEFVLAQQTSVQQLGHPQRMIYVVHDGKELPGHPG